MLVQSLLDETSSEDEVVARAAGLVRHGEVVLTGNFKGCVHLGGDETPRD
jgi:hypothetical protein